MEDCIFCKIIAGQIPCDKVYEDEKIIVFKDIHPKARVHLLIVSRDHIINLMNTNGDQTALLGHMLNVQKELTKEQGLSNGFRTVINTGSGGGQEIDHLHFHMLGGGSLPRF